MFDGDTTQLLPFCPPTTTTATTTTFAAAAFGV